MAGIRTSLSKHAPQLLLATIILISIPYQAAYGQITPESFGLGDFATESGVVLQNAKITYTTEGGLNAQK